MTISNIIMLREVMNISTSPGDMAYKFKVMHSLDSLQEFHNVKIAEYAVKMLEEAYLRDVSTHEKQIVALDENIKAIEEVKALMSSLKFPTSYSVPVKSRARFAKYKFVDAGWIEDIKKIITNDGYSTMLKEYERKKTILQKNFVDVKFAKEIADNKKEYEKEAIINKRKADMKLAGLLVKYGREASYEWEDLLQYLSSTDKYLSLAIAMQNARMSFDRVDEVRDELYAFHATSAEDQSIVEEIRGALDNWDGDGRIFRDINYSYDVLFSMVEDKDLLTDVFTVMENIK